MWCCELYCLILSKLTLTKWASGLKIFLQRHHRVLCYCFLPHSTLCFGTWGLGGCKPRFCFVSILLPAGFCQPERQEEGARTCSFQFVCWFCCCHPSGFQEQPVPVPSFLPHSQTSSIMLAAAAARQHPSSEVWDSSLRCLRDQQAIPSEVWVLGLQTPRSGKLILFPWIPGPRSGSCFLSYSLCDHSASFSLFSLPPLEPISSIKFSAKITRMVYLLLGP